jgi:hypothetical protein
MQHDAELIMDLWSRIKPHIAQKERIDVADQIIAVFDEHGMVDGIEDMAGSLDRPLAAAVISRYGLDIIEDDDDERYENQY